MTGAEMDREFALERYRYVLEQKRELNKTTFLLVAIYQAGLALVAGANLAVRTALSKRELTDVAAEVLLKGSAWLLLAVTGFALVMLVSGVLSWLGCRREEAAIEAVYLGVARPLPTMRSALAWYETYIAIAMIAITSGYFLWMR